MTDDNLEFWIYSVITPTICASKINSVIFWWNVSAVFTADSQNDRYHLVLTLFRRAHSWSLMKHVHSLELILKLSFLEWNILLLGCPSKLIELTCSLYHYYVVGKVLNSSSFLFLWKKIKLRKIATLSESICSWILMTCFKPFWLALSHYIFGLVQYMYLSSFWVWSPVGVGRFLSFSKF